MNISEDDRRAMIALLLGGDGHFAVNPNYATLLVRLVRPEDVLHRLVTLTASSMRVLLLTEDALIHANFPELPRPDLTGGVSPVDVFVWKRPLSAVTGVRITNVRVWSNQAGPDTQATWALEFAHSDDLKFPWDEDWKSFEAASELAAALLERWPAGV